MESVLLFLLFAISAVASSPIVNTKRLDPQGAIAILGRITDSDVEKLHEDGRRRVKRDTLEDLEGRVSALEAAIQTVKG